MIDRNADLRAFQSRARELCEGEFTTIQLFAKKNPRGNQSRYEGWT